MSRISDRGKLHYGQVQRSAMNWPFFVASELDLFATQNLGAEARIFTFPPEPVAALIDGSLDVINVIPDVAILEMVKGAPLSLIAKTNIRFEYRLVSQPGIRDFKELEGKKIGINDGRSAEALILRRLLREKGLPPDSYELTLSGPPPKRCEELMQGLIAATMVTEPFHFCLEEEGFRLLGSSLEILPQYPFTMCVVRRQDKVDEKFVRFLKCLKQAWAWLADPGNRKRAVEILMRSTDTTEKGAQATYELYFLPPSPPSLDPTEEGVTSALELLAESGRLPYPIPPAGRYIDERYIKRLEA